MIATLAARPAVRASVVGAYVLLVEWTRALVGHAPYAAVPSLLLGGAALGVATLPWSREKLGLNASRLPLRLLGGLALGAVLLLPAAVRSSAAPVLPAGLAAAAIAISVGEELAFRGALYAALDELGGAPLAVLGSTALWTLAHILSHPPEFLGAVFAAGLLLGLWRWAAKDLVGPIVAHVIADLAL